MTLIGDGYDKRLVPLPCHHGCTCRLEEMVTRGAATARRDEKTLDNGEMRALFTAAREAHSLLLGYRDALAKDRDRLIRAFFGARSAIEALTRLALLGSIERTRAAADATERRHAEDAPEDRQRPRWWLRLLGVLVIAGIAVFDTWYFVRAFLDILGVPRDAPAWQKGIGVIPGVMLAAGMILAGRLLAGLPRARQPERRSAAAASPGQWRSRGRLALSLSFPVLILCVLALWGYLRALDADPSPLAVTVLLVTLAITAIAFEVVAHSPYAERRKAADRALRAAEKTYRNAGEAVDQRMLELDAAWRRLRSSRDELVSLARVQLGVAWEALILPARMHHRGAGDLAPALLPTGSGAPTGEWLTDVETPEDVERIFQFFDRVQQPLPGLGPLAETFRVVRDYDPAPLRRRRDELVADLDTQLAGMAGPGKAG